MACLLNGCFLGKEEFSMDKWYHIFIVDKEKDSPDGKLRFRVRWGKNIVAFNLGFRVEFSKWSTDTQRCKNNTTHGKKKVMASVINREINRYEEAAEKIFYNYKQKGIEPTKELFKADFLREVRNIEPERNEETVGLFQRFDEFMKETGFKNSWTDATYKKFNTIKSHLKNFDPDLSFEKLDEQGLTNFVVHLRDKANLRNSTIAKDIGFLKWFLRWCTQKGYNNVHDFNFFHPKLKSTENKVIFLEWDELMKVYNFEFPKNKGYLERARDVFCFCCFTSLRYSDVANLKWHNISKDSITITTVKTSDTLKIELNNFALEILEKYKDKNYPGNMALPVVSNQKMNDYIKEVGYICGIDTPINITYYRGNERIDEIHPKYELLGTHSGRRTFICNALMLGIPPEVVMKWTGHSDYKSMKPYIDVADSTKMEAMKLFNQKSQK